jgi:transcriptional regulator with XRE-family HTH domain
MQSNEQVKKREYLSMTPKDIGEGVELLRKQFGWKQFALADEAQINERTVQRIERGEKVSSESLRRVARALHIDAEAFLEPVPLPTVEEWEKAKKCSGEHTFIEALTFTTLNDCAAVLATHVFLLDERAVNEKLADQVAAFKDMLTDWGDVYGDLSHMDRLQACREVLAGGQKITAEGYTLRYGLYVTEDRWKFKVAILVLTPTDDGRMLNVTHFFVPRTLSGLQKGTW